MRDEESNRRIQAVKPKKQTATMKRRGLKLRTAKADRGFLTRVQVKHEAITTKSDLNGCLSDDAWTDGPVGRKG